MCPAGQEPQEACPVEPWNFPEGHEVQEVPVKLFEGWYFPVPHAGQVLQDLYCPGEHEAEQPPPPPPPPGPPPPHSWRMACCDKPLRLAAISHPPKHCPLDVEPLPAVVPPPGQAKHEDLPVEPW